MTIKIGRFRCFSFQNNNNYKIEHNSQLILATFLATSNKTTDILTKKRYKKTAEPHGAQRFY